MNLEAILTMIAQASALAVRLSAEGGRATTPDERAALHAALDADYLASRKRREDAIEKAEQAG